MSQVHHKFGITEPAIYRWKHQFAGMGRKAPYLEFRTSVSSVKSHHRLHPPIRAPIRACQASFLR